MANRGRSIQRFPSSQKRKTSWNAGPGGTTKLDVNTSVSAVVGQGINAIVGGLILVRLRGDLTAYLVAATASDDGFSCAFGIGLANLEAFTVGIGSLMSPLVESDWDGWLYHKFINLHSGGIVNASAQIDRVAVNPTSAAVRIDVDSKAMRKVPEDMVIYAAFESVLQGTADMRLQFNSRILFKLS